MGSLGLDVETIKTVSLIVIGVLILLAVLSAVVIKAIVGKLIALVVIIALAVAVWVQRDNLTNCVQSCQCTFFGFEVEIPQQVKDQYCPAQ